MVKRNGAVSVLTKATIGICVARPIAVASSVFMTIAALGFLARTYSTWFFINHSESGIQLLIADGRIYAYEWRGTRSTSGEWGIVDAGGRIGAKSPSMLGPLAPGAVASGSRIILLHGVPALLIAVVLSGATVLWAVGFRAYWVLSGRCQYCGYESSGTRCSECGRQLQ